MSIKLDPIVIPATDARTITPERITRRLTVEWTDNQKEQPSVWVTRVTRLYDDKGDITLDVPGVVAVGDYPDDTYVISEDNLKAIAPEFIGQAMILRDVSDKLDQVKISERDQAEAAIAAEADAAEKMG